MHIKFNSHSYYLLFSHTRLQKLWNVYIHADIIWNKLCKSHVVVYPWLDEDHSISKIQLERYKVCKNVSTMYMQVHIHFYFIIILPIILLTKFDILYILICRIRQKDIWKPLIIYITWKSNGHKIVFLYMYSLDIITEII